MTNRRRWINHHSDRRYRLSGFIDRRRAKGDLMNRTIKVENNPKDYALGVFLQLIGIVSEAKRRSGY